MAETKFKVGDHVWSQHSGVGVIVSINDDPNVSYPIRVQWTDVASRSLPSTDVFTMDGRYNLNGGFSDCDIYWIPYSEEKETAGEVKFKAGDKVISRYFGGGIVVEVDQVDPEYPVLVRWDNPNRYEWRTSRYTLNGDYDKDDHKRDLDIVHVEENVMGDFKVGDRAEHVWHGLGVITEVGENPITPVCIRFDNGVGGYYSPKSIRKITSNDAKDNDSYVSRDIEPASDKKTDAINPSHYRVEGIPEAIEIMRGLMTKEQFEGFLWGNILKYAYRYGRKGDKKETAGKIAWYAKKLEEAVSDAAV